MVLFMVIAIVLPLFNRIMTLLGSIACFIIYIILPLVFYLKLFRNEIPAAKKWMNWVLIVINAVIASISTVFTFFLKEILGV